MNRLIFYILIGILFSCSVNQEFTPKKSDLVNKWDTIRPLANPDKGWYHHILDNGVGKYLIQDEDDLVNFPGLDHFYIRMAWAFLEPEEGKFDWSYIDDIVEKYVPMGYGVSFRISCKETGPAPTSVPNEVNGTRFATPYWVSQAGAKGIEHPEYGSASWTPVWNDPVFLDKLDNFHKAFAEKFDGKPWVRYIDAGSIGEWGEGHTHFSTRIPPTVEEVKTHMNLHLKHYRNTQLIANDDLLASGKSANDQQELLNYALKNGFSLRDDSPLVQWHMLNHLDSWTVRHADFFNDPYKTMPTVFELEHYIKVKDNGYWLGKNGKDTIPEIGVSGADVFHNAVKIIRPTYVGYHGYMGEWLEDNPDFTREILNLCGYWYFPGSIHTTHYKNRKLTFEIEWLNKGVAPAYSDYQLKGKLIPVDNTYESIDFEIEDSGNKKWMPGQCFIERYTASLSDKPKGNYWLAIQLYDKRSEKPVEIGITIDMEQDGYFRIQNLSF